MVTTHESRYLSFHLEQIEEMVTLLIATVDRHEISDDDYTVTLDGFDLRKRLQEIKDSAAAALVLT